jgi:DNA-binding NarL/FixJ family response regulator
MVPPERAVAVVDDDPQSREGCALILEGTGWEAVGFERAALAVEAARGGTLPRFVLMDMSLPGESAGGAIAEILRANPNALIVALTSFQREDFVFEALRAGAVGYLLKQHALGELAALLDLVERGGSPLSPSVARRVLGTFREEAARFEPLSAREQAILACFAGGQSYAEAAAELGVAIDTVRTHVRRMYAKLRVSNRSEAVVAGLRRGLVR